MREEGELLSQAIEVLRFERVEVRDEIVLHDMIGNGVLTCDFDNIRQEHVSRLKTFVLGMEKKKIEIQWPHDWWQALKLRFAPWWFRRRYPVQYETFEQNAFGKVYLSVFPDKTTKHREREPIAFQSYELLSVYDSEFYKKAERKR